MPVRVKTEGVLARREATAYIGRAIRSSYNDLGDELLDTLQKDLPGHYKKSAREKVTGKGFDTKLTLYSNAEGIEAIEEGRGPGKQPPPDTILKWVRRKGLGGKALSIKTRRALVAGITRTRERGGRLRTRAQSLLANQKSIAFLIGRAIGKQGLPRRTGHKPSHRLFLFRDIQKHYPAIVSASNKTMQLRVNQILNS